MENLELKEFMSMYKIPRDERGYTVFAISSVAGATLIADNVIDSRIAYLTAKAYIRDMNVPDEFSKFIGMVVIKYLSDATVGFYRYIAKPQNVEL